MKQDTVSLSKWWLTASAQAAFRRAEITRKEASNKRIAAMKAKKQAIIDAALNWKAVK